MEQVFLGNQLTIQQTFWQLHHLKCEYNDTPIFKWESVVTNNWPWIQYLLLKSLQRNVRKTVKSHLVPTSIKWPPFYINHVFHGLVVSISSTHVFIPDNDTIQVRPFLAPTGGLNIDVLLYFLKIALRDIKFYIFFIQFVLLQFTKILDTLEIIWTIFKTFMGVTFFFFSKKSWDGH